MVLKKSPAGARKEMVFGFAQDGHCQEVAAAAVVDSSSWVLKRSGNLIFLPIS